jgi:hypothetical protein
MKLEANTFFGKKWLTILSACVLVAALATLASSSRNLIATAKPASYDVQIAPQPDSPLRVTIQTVTASTSFEVAADLAVTNIGDKSISSFAVRHDDYLQGGSKASGVTLVTAASVNGALLPNASNPVSTGAHKYSEEVVKIILSIDFVEFTDGTTWGEDKEKSAELLAGRRAGAKTAREKLSERFQKEGAASVAQAIERDGGGEEFAPPSDKSLIWQRGYTNGVKSIYARVRHAKSQGGLEKIKEAVDRPFTAVEGGN